METLRRSIDRLIEDFDHGLFPSRRRRLIDIEPFRSFESITAPAADMTETETAYELSVELPGMDENDIDVKMSNHMLTISGEKKEEKEEKRKDYFLSERRFGSFQRSFRVPEGVDVDKVDATFSKGVLKVVLPKTAAAQQSEKKVKVKTA